MKFADFKYIIQNIYDNVVFYQIIRSLIPFIVHIFQVLGANTSRLKYCSWINNEGISNEIFPSCLYSLYSKYNIYNNKYTSSEEAYSFDKENWKWQFLKKRLTIVYRRATKWLPTGKFYPARRKEKKYIIR